MSEVTEVKPAIENTQSYPLKQINRTMSLEKQIKSNARNLSTILTASFLFFSILLNAFMNHHVLERRNSRIYQSKLAKSMTTKNGGEKNVWRRRIWGAIWIWRGIFLTSTRWYLSLRFRPKIWRLLRSLWLVLLSFQSTPEQTILKRTDVVLTARQLKGI